MQVNGRTGGVMGMISAVWVRSAKWVGEMQHSGRTGGVIGKNSAVRGRSVEWVGRCSSVGGWVRGWG